MLVSGVAHAGVGKRQRNMGAGLGEQLAKQVGLLSRVLRQWLEMNVKGEEGIARLPGSLLPPRSVAPRPPHVLMKSERRDFLSVSV